MQNYMLNIHYNWLAVLVSVVIMMVLGMSWYSKSLFGDKWAKLLGKESMKDMQGMGNPTTAIMFSIVFAIIISVVMAVMIGVADAFSWKWGLFMGFLAWLGFTLTTVGQGNVYQNKPWMLTVIDTGYYLVGFLLI